MSKKRFALFKAGQDLDNMEINGNARKIKKQTNCKLLNKTKLRLFALWLDMLTFCWMTFDLFNRQK